MSEIRHAKLELLRQGPAHNQLLSPLTPYLALCGPSAPRMLHVPYEHRQLLLRLARLRYQQGDCAVPAAQREGELRELGEQVGALLGQVPALATLLQNALRDEARLVHLRLSLSALELGMVPFEVAIAPDEFPGSGAPMLLRLPLVITRELRRTEPIAVEWNRRPRILFAYATPPGQPPVPASEHLKALRRAIEPFVPLRDEAEDRLPDVEAMLTVVPEATLEAVTRACQQADYTHVHILAHGAPFEEAGHTRYGVALRKGVPDGDGADVVSGERLTLALCGAGLNDRTKKPPTLVSLATCDSGNVETVVAPGGSIAHGLHDAGIPWVVASQFPLWMSASTLMTELLYAGLLAGADPRIVLHDLRQQLRARLPDTHDWASLVVYAVTPWDFDAQVAAFRDKRVRARLDTLFSRIDELAKRLTDRQALGPEQHRQAAQLAAQLRQEHKVWLDRIAPGQRKARAEVLGMCGANEKRLAIYDGQNARRLLEQHDTAGAKAAMESSRKAYEASRDAYRQALLLEPTNHWVATQFLSVIATPVMAADDAAIEALRREYGDWWTAARQNAQWQMQGASGEDRAWALGTLAELDLLATVYASPRPTPADLKASIARHCGQLVQVVGAEAFAVTSTMRQFLRYRMHWPHERWDDLVQAALDALGWRPPPGSGAGPPPPAETPARRPPVQRGRRAARR